MYRPVDMNNTSTNDWSNMSILIFDKAILIIIFISQLLKHVELLNNLMLRLASPFFVILLQGFAGFFKNQSIHR